MGLDALSLGIIAVVVLGCKAIADGVLAVLELRDRLRRRGLPA
jgi:hypothetical protein